MNYQQSKLNQRETRQFPDRYVYLWSGIDSLVISSPELMSRPSVNIFKQHLWSWFLTNSSVLVICKFAENPIKNEYIIAKTTFFPFR